MYPLDLISSNKDFEVNNRTNSLKNCLDIQNIPTFSRNELVLSEENENHFNYYSSFNDHALNDSWKINMENTNDRIEGISTIDNSCDKFIIHELSSKIYSINNKKSNLEIINNQNISKRKEDNIKSPKKKIKIFEVIYSNHHRVFDHYKYDDYSSLLIDEISNEANKKSKKIKVKKIKFLSSLQKYRKKKKKNIVRRKQNSDNIRKKIKARFLKTLKEVINQKLKKAGSKMFFSFFPQSFVCILTKKTNRIIFDMALKDIYLTNFNYEESGRNAIQNVKKYKHNLSVLKYLENDTNISEKSYFNIIKNMKLSEIYKDYFTSTQFCKVISTLKQEKENEKYIKAYIIKAKNFIKFFNS